MKTFASLFAHSHLAVVLFCFAAMADDRPNMIVITADELRWDGLSVTGHPFAETPNIDRLAREGMLFENAFVPLRFADPAEPVLSQGNTLTRTAATRIRPPKVTPRSSKPIPCYFNKRDTRQRLSGNGLRDAMEIRPYTPDSIAGSAPASIETTKWIRW